MTKLMGRLCGVFENALESVMDDSPIPEINNRYNKGEEVNNTTNVTVTININFDSASNTGYQEESVADREMRIFYKRFC